MHLFIPLKLCIWSYTSRFYYPIIEQNNMKNRKPNNNKQQYEPDYDNPNSSISELTYGKPQNQLSPQKSRENLYDDERRNIKQAKKEGLDHLYKENYQPAKYGKAVQYRNSRSYMKKLPSGHYKELDLFADTEELKYFGLGAYFYIEFFRRITWLFFLFTVFVALTIYINWLGSGMGNYSPSFSTYLIKSTMGNYSKNMLTAYDGYLVTIVPAFNFFVLFLFYLCWKGHFFQCINEQQQDNYDVKPQKFCLEIQAQEEGYFNEEDLTRFFSSFGPVYEVSLVRRYKNKLSYFQQLDQIEEELKEEQLQVILGGGDKETVNALRKQKEKLQRYISTLQIRPRTISAYVHFQYQKSKVDCLTYFNNHYLFDQCCHSCMRSCCCCCVPTPQEKYLFNGKPLLIKSQKVPTPEDINWGSFQLSFCSRFCRGFCAFMVILIFLAISCAIIGLCSIYISSHASNCDGITVPGTYTLAQATNSSTVLRCFCEANFISSFSDYDIKTACSDYLTEIQISQGIQYAVIFASGLTNFLFSLVVDKLVNFVRPASKSAGLLTKTTIYTVFIIFNSVFIPLLIYADIFGFQPSNYVSFITLISSGVKNFFAVSNLSFYPNFNAVWYKNVSVIFVNFIIVNTIVAWVFFLIDKCSASKTTLEDDEGRILQKHMNEQITAYKLDVYKEAANFYLIIVMVMLFATGVPALVPLGFINFLSRYITNRSLLQNNSSHIEGLGEDFMSLTLGLLPFVMIVCPVVGEWMLTANTSIYPNQLPMTFPYFHGLIYQLDVQLYLPFYLALSLIALTEFFLYNTLIRCCSWMCSLCYQRKQVTHPYHTRPFSEYVKGMNILSSFNIRNNDQMRNVMLNMEKFLVDKEVN